jgi:hypothetical protein
VLPLATEARADSQVRLVVGTSDGTVTVQPMVWADLAESRTSAPALVDATPVADTLGRRILAAHLNALLTELAADTTSTSAVVHVDASGAPARAHWSNYCLAPANARSGLGGSAGRAVRGLAGEHDRVGVVVAVSCDRRGSAPIPLAFGMLLAIKSHTRHTEGEDALARSAILLVRFPVLADRLRTDHLPAGTRPDATIDADPLWQHPTVRQVLGKHSLDTLARCLGRRRRSRPSRRRVY